MNEPPRCATCKHWNGLEYPTKAEDVWVNDKHPIEGQSGTIQVGGNEGAWGECEAPSSPGWPGRSRLFQVWDASQYQASLTTRDVFGCVEHEPR